MNERMLFPSHSLAHLQRTVILFRKAHPGRPIDTIDLHLLSGGGGRSDTGTTVRQSRLAAFGRFVARNAHFLGIAKDKVRNRRRDSAGRMTTCAIWLTS